MSSKVKDFVNKWAGRGNEKQVTQQYWNGLIFNVLVHQQTQRYSIRCSQRR